VRVKLSSRNSPWCTLLGVRSNINKEYSAGSIVALWNCGAECEQLDGYFPGQFQVLGCVPVVGDLRGCVSESAWVSIEVRSGPLGGPLNRVGGIELCAARLSSS
jgi:hypothetical protein